MSTLSATEVLDALAHPLREWLPRQRWFASKHLPVDGVETLSAVWLDEGDPGLLHAQVTVRQQDSAEAYQLLLGLSQRPPAQAEVIGTVDGAAAFDATTEPALAGRLLDFFADPADRRGIEFTLDSGAALETGLPARAIGVEQSNTSLIFGDEYILKLYRRPQPGAHRDLELHHLLHAAGSRNIAAPVGSIRAGDTVLGFLQRFLPGATEGWDAAVTAVRALAAPRNPAPSDHAPSASAGVGSDFADEARLLGAAVAAVHHDLARAGGSSTANAEQVAAMVASMHARLDVALTHVPALAAHERAVRAAYNDLASEPLAFQHVHGDLHLGQVLRTESGWVLIDFEGEPAATPADRAALSSPLRDVAGMLRSFDYAAHPLRVGGDQGEAQAAEWVERNCAAFCDGYAGVGDDPRAHRAALRAFELDKVVYEAAYERQNRPDWLPIPLAALSRLTASATAI